MSTTRPQVVALDGPAKGQVVELGNTPVVIGRVRGCQLLINADSISKKHCELVLADGHAVIRDLGSRNGTKVNGKRVETATLLPGDVIRLGRISLRFELGAAGAPAAADGGSRRKSGVRRAVSPTRLAAARPGPADTDPTDDLPDDLPPVSPLDPAEAPTRPQPFAPIDPAALTAGEEKTEVAPVSEGEKTALLPKTSSIFSVPEAVSRPGERPTGIDESALVRVIDRLVSLFEIGEFYGHSRRVRQFASLMAKAMHLAPDQQKCLAIAATLHDVGNLRVPVAILRKAGELSDTERAEVEQHTIAGAEIVRGMELPLSVMEAVRSHHERFDGKGYPDRLRGAEIPLLGRVLAVAEAAIGMASDRPYRPRKDPAAIIVILTRGSGTLYDPEIIPVALEALKSPAIIS